MTRDELLILLEKGRRIEEAILLYSEHIRNTLYLSGFNKSLRNNAREMLNTLHRECYEHTIFLKQLIEQVEKGDNNVY
jgi:hypothetical protein